MAKDYYDQFNKIRVGDRIYDDCSGPCSGGASYGIYDKVVRVTKREIITADGSAFSRKTGRATRPPWAYYIGFWRMKTKRKK